jgi:mannose-6-phosphate isomerase-like protein (cupin superfamily)
MAQAVLCCTSNGKVQDNNKEKREKTSMKKNWSHMAQFRGLLFAAGVVFAAAPGLPQASQPHPLVMPLECPQGDCPILKGVPQTAGMRSGFVRLKPGQTVGWHTTGKNEEALVVLHGTGKALIDGQPGLPFTAPSVVYIPPATRHNVENTGADPLEYEYVVAPAQAP